tara:strand:+ start:987 stop:1628 length:642 start_codon:yes stop_codon:yes gene_type:complete
MASHYFSNLPNIQYRNPLSSSYDSENYVTAKNLFIRTKIRDDVLPDISFLRSYTIEDSERPMDVAEKIYGDPMYDWVVMITSNIINVRTDWPLSSKSLYEYCADKYGGDLNATRFYETREIKDKQGRLVMPGGKKVDKTFTIPHPDNHNITLSGDDLVLGISNFLAETRENEKKRNIRLMRREYLIGFVQEMVEELQYVPSSQTRNRELKRAG